MSSSAPPARPRAPRRPAPPAPAKRPVTAQPPEAWEDRVLLGVDRVLARSLGTSSKDEGPGDRRPASKTSGLFSSSWKKAGAVEVVGAAMILLFAIVARPSADEARAATAPDLRTGVAAQVTDDGGVVLSDGHLVRLLGVSLPIAEEQPAERRAALAGIERLVLGRAVRIEYDPVLPSASQGDRSTVGYVWILDEAGRQSSMLNAVLIANGLATPVPGVAYRHAMRFDQAAQLAMSRRAGMWR